MPIFVYARGLNKIDSRALYLRAAAMIDDGFTNVVRLEFWVVSSGVRRSGCLSWLLCVTDY